MPGTARAGVTADPGSRLIPLGVYGMMGAALQMEE